MLFFFLIVYIAAINALPIDIQRQIKAMIYLEKFGYLASARQDGKSALLLDEETTTRALKNFQRFVGLEVTGILDKPTIEKMGQPRCAIPDIISGANLRRRKRYTLFGIKFQETNVTYHVEKYPQRRLRNHKKVDRALANAFKMWSDVAPLTFTNEKKRKDTRANIHIRFEAGQHGHPDTFDGPQNVVAFATSPSSDFSRVEFDDEEEWTVAGFTGVSLLWVAGHEFGHSLGLGHSSSPGAIMEPHIPTGPVVKLNEDDIRGIQFLYGTRDPKTLTTSDDDIIPSNDTGEAPDVCQDPTIDAITRTKDGNTYVFKDNYYWQLLRTGIAEGYPRPISADWDGLPGDLDAAITWPDGRTFFFKKDWYWEFINTKKVSGYPKPISAGFPGIPNDINAAYYWTWNSRAYFYKDVELWVFDSEENGVVEQLLMRNWRKGMPEDIDAAFQWENNRTYYFKERNYYIFSGSTFVDTLPRSTAVDWFGCNSTSNITEESAGIKVSKQVPHEDYKSIAAIITDPRDAVISDNEITDGCERNLAPLLSMTIIFCALCLLA